jgi:hypothetical protein
MFLLLAPGISVFLRLPLSACHRFFPNRMQVDRQTTVRPSSANYATMFLIEARLLPPVLEAPFDSYDCPIFETVVVLLNEC